MYMENMINKYDLNTTEITLLREIIRSPEERYREYSNRMDMAKVTVYKNVQKLKEKGYVTIEKRGRYNDIKPTEKGITTIEKIGTYLKFWRE